MTTTRPPVRTVPAPADLAALIDAYTAAWVPGGDYRDQSRTHAEMVAWRGWRKRTRYVHGGVSVAMVWGSLDVRQNPESETDR
jgi:hypothetical protein